MSINRKRSIWVAVVVTSVFGSALALAMNRKIVADTNPEKTGAPASVSSAGEPKPRAYPTPLPVTSSVGPAQMVRFTVYDEGIRPTVAHASPGLVSIYLDDKSTHTPSLLIADAQHPIGAITRQIGKLRGHNTVTLTPGRYMIYEANRRSNAATLIVAP
jgi:hypothetical protein